MKRQLKESILCAAVMIGLGSCVNGQQPATIPPADAPVYSQPAQNNSQPAQSYGQTVAPPMTLDQAPSADSSRWPMQATTADGAQVIIFQPQLESFDGNQLQARSAVAVTPANQQTQVFGAIWLQSRVETDRVNRTVRILDVNVSKAQFPGADPVAEPLLAGAVRQVLLAQPATLSLDQLLAMVQTVQKAGTTAQELQNTPPRILFLDHPAMKIQYDGAPRLGQVQGSNLFQAVNTPFFVALDPNSKLYFLKGAGRWFSSPDPVGQFQLTAQVPAEVAKLADTTGYKDPAQPISDAQAAAMQIITATEPTELVWTAGEAQLGTIPGTDLLYFTNSDADVFMSIDNQQWYVLLSGRWYSAPDRNGPWAFVAPDKLPADFQRIPPTSDKADVLAHVSGTMAAQDAIADAQIPQTAAVDRHTYQQPTVEYDGDPNFQAIEGTSVGYAVNTPASVLTVNGQYYCCDNGVWYQSGAPQGQWMICTAVPTEIYAIPPSCPLYPVRYCHVYGYTPEVCYVGYTPGYTGCYEYNGVVVYGTGYRYHPWEGQRFYVPRQPTFGFGAHYNSYSGHWGFSFALSAGGGSWVRPQQQPDQPHFREREEHWFGYGGYRPTYGHSDAEIHNTFVRNEISQRPAPAQTGRDVLGRNVYQNRHDLRTDVIREAPRDNTVPQRGEGARQNPGARADQGARANQGGQGVSGNRGEQPAAQRGSGNAGGNQTPASINPRDYGNGNGRGNGTTYNAPQAKNDVFTDRNGNVYRRTLDGWEQRDNTKNQWNALPRGTAPAGATAAATPAPASPQPTVITPRNGTESVPRVMPPAPQNQTPANPAPAATPDSSRGQQPAGDQSRGAQNRAGARARGAAEQGGSGTNGPTAGAAPAGEAPANGAPSAPARGNAAPAGNPSAGNPSTSPPVAPHLEPARSGTATPPADPPRNQAPANNPRGGAAAARGEPPAPAPKTPAPAPAPAAPAPKEPAPASPPPAAPTGDLNKDYHARVVGAQRDKSYHQPAPAPAPPAPAPPAPTPPAPRPAAPPAAAAPQPAPPDQSAPARGARRSGTRSN